MSLGSFIPFARGLMQRIHVLWRQERTAVAQADAAGQTKGPDLPGACMEIAIATLTFSLQAHNLKVIAISTCETPAPVAGVFVLREIAKIPEASVE